MAGARKTQTTGQYSMISPITRSAREEEVDQNLGTHVFIITTLIKPTLLIPSGSLICIGL